MTDQNQTDDFILDLLKGSAAFRELQQIDSDLDRISRELQQLLSAKFDPSELDQGEGRPLSIAERVAKLLRDTQELMWLRLKPAEVLSSIRHYERAHRDGEVARVQSVIARQLLVKLRKLQAQIAPVAANRLFVDIGFRHTLIDHGVPMTTINTIETRYRVPDEKVIAWWESQASGTGPDDRKDGKRETVPENERKTP